MPVNGPQENLLRENKMHKPHYLAQKRIRMHMEDDVCFQRVCLKGTYVRPKDIAKTYRLTTVA